MRCSPISKRSHRLYPEGRGQEGRLPPPPHTPSALSQGKAQKGRAWPKDPPGKPCPVPAVSDTRGAGAEGPEWQAAWGEGVKLSKVQPRRSSGRPGLVPPPPIHVFCCGLHASTRAGHRQTMWREQLQGLGQQQ